MKSVLIGLLTLLCSTVVFAQPGTYMPADTSKFLFFDAVTAGPFFTVGVSRMNENITPGWHTNPSFANTFGGLVDLEVNKWVAFDLGIAYDSRGLYEATEQDSVSADMGVQYLCIQPALRLYWLVVGLSLNFPMSGSATLNVKKYSAAGDYVENKTIANSDITGGSELRGVLSIPIYKAESGILHLLLTANYPMGKVLAGTSSFDSTESHVFKDVGAGKLPAFEAGVSYQFDLLHLDL